MFCYIFARSVYRWDNKLIGRSLSINSLLTFAFYSFFDLLLESYFFTCVKQSVFQFLKFQPRFPNGCVGFSFCWGVKCLTEFKSFGIFGLSIFMCLSLEVQYEAAYPGWKFSHSRMPSHLLLYFDHQLSRGKCCGQYSSIRKNNLKPLVANVQSGYEQEYIWNIHYKIKNEIKGNKCYISFIINIRSF